MEEITPKINSLNDLWYYLLLVITALADHFVHNPISSLAAVIMLLVSWERYKSSKAKRKKIEAEAKEMQIQSKISERSYQNMLRQEERERNV